ncbi:MAG: hypothetical protein K2K44_05045 [Oscillospiraceae bacterium]|nr:hypothetical protein [Oscillospiraceae bacterium]
MKKTITACLVCAVLACGMCGCSGGEEASSAERTISTVTEASETVPETSVATEAKTETETSETTEATKSTEVLTVSPSGYILDPNVTLGEENGWYYTENQPCLIGEPLEGVRFYGVNAGEEKSYTDDEYDQYIIVEHDGIADEFEGFWTERFGTAMSVYSGDFDGDGEDETAASRYSAGGTACAVNELSVYKIKDGHYQRFLFDENSFIDKYLTYEVDAENQIVSFSVESLGRTFSYDFSEDMPNGGCVVVFGLINKFEFDGGDIIYTATPHLSGSGICTKVSISFRLKFSDGDFICTDAEFSENKF